MSRQQRNQLWYGAYCLSVVSLVWCLFLHAEFLLKHQPEERKIDEPRRATTQQTKKIHEKVEGKGVEAKVSVAELPSLKVLLIGNQGHAHFPLTGMGGIEAHVEAVAEGLYKNGVNFEVVVPAKGVGTNQSYPFPVHYTSYKPRSDKCRPNCTVFIKEVRSYIEAKSNETKPDIIWSQSTWSADGLHDLGIPIIVTYGDSGGSKSLKSYPNVVHRFVSKDQRNRWIEGDPNKKKSNPWLVNQSFFLWEGFPEEEFDLSVEKDPCTIMFVGKIVSHKGIDEFQQLAKMHPECKFVAYGEGIFKPRHKNVEFRGILERGPDHKRAFQQATKFFMFVKWQEAFGRVIVEALSKGTPVLGCDQGALPELLPSHVGVASSNLTDLSAAIKKDYDPQVVFEYAQKHFRAIDEAKALLEVSRAMLKYPTNREEMLKHIDPRRLER